MQLLLVSVHLHFGSKTVAALLVLADERMAPSVGLLLLLPLHGMLIGLVLPHLPWEDAAPPDVELVLAQLALPAPLLSVVSANVVLKLFL